MVSNPRARVVRGDALISSSCCDKSRGLGGLNNKHLFPTVLEAEVQDQGACTVGFFVRALFLVLASHGLFLVCALGAERESKRKGGGERERERDQVSSFFYEDTNASRGPHPYDFI